MAKGMYVGANNIAKKVNKIYVGVNGVAQQVKKIYVGVNGTAQLSYTSGPNPSVNYAVKFSNDGSFVVGAKNPQWNGTLEYSVDDGDSWTTWSGNQINGNAETPIYMRGIGNTKLSINGVDNSWIFTGKYCEGNIENLLNYQTVMQGGHPTMGQNCCDSMFHDCINMLTTPDLSQANLASYCYYTMFKGCTSLVSVCTLPVPNLDYSNCYSWMFEGCTSLSLNNNSGKVLLDLSSSGSFVVRRCCEGMFSGNPSSFSLRTGYIVYYVD